MVRKWAHSKPNAGRSPDDLSLTRSASHRQERIKAPHSWLTCDLRLLLRSATFRDAVISSPDMLSIARKTGSGKWHCSVSGNGQSPLWAVSDVGRGAIRSDRIESALYCDGRDGGAKTRQRRISEANFGPNLFHQKRTVSWLMSMPRSWSRSSTFLSNSGNRTYIITARRMISWLVLKYLNGSRFSMGAG